MAEVVLSRFKGELTMLDSRGDSDGIAMSGPAPEENAIMDDDVPF